MSSGPDIPGAATSALLAPDPTPSDGPARLSPGRRILFILVRWPAFAVGLMLIGVWMRRKAYRLSAIVLLIITVLKVLAYDTAEVSTPYRILSCLVLGAMLVAVSFLYYRFSERLAGK